MTILNANTLPAVATIAAAGAVIFLVMKTSKATGEVAKVLDKVNPVNPDNIVAQGANRIVADVSGVPNRTVGQAIFKFFNPKEAAELCQAGQPALCDAEEGKKTLDSRVIAEDKFFVGSGEFFKSIGV